MLSECGKNLETCAAYEPILRHTDVFKDPYILYTKGHEKCKYYTQKDMKNVGKLRCNNQAEHADRPYICSPTSCLL